MMDIQYFLRESGARLTQTLFMEEHYIFSKADLKKFFQLATEWEREACAKVCDDIFRHWIQTDPDEKFATPDADDCARAIRARGAVELRGETK